jgi:hypothetical protein
MGLLDQLLEKKDLMVYIDFRIKHLRAEDIRNIMNLPEAKREAAHLKANGRIQELYQLRKVVAQGKLKEQSKMYFNLTKGDDQCQK